MAHIFSVRELTTALGEVVESEFPFVWVRGQVTNLARPESGHIYFTLADGEAILPVVWFKNNQWQGGDGGTHPLTGEILEKDVVELEDGMEILCAGKLTVYRPRGTYQLVAELVQEQGVGELQAAFEVLKRELLKLGYFDADRKMSLPASVQRIALVTAPSGAAIRDFLRIAGDRGTGLQIRIYPTLVQGEKAPSMISAAVKQACEEDWAEVIVLVRGGGSLEDLWAFNTREVADAVYESTLPVLCGVGHETDTSIADHVADVRAATPSHAAQLLLPERTHYMQRVDDLSMRLESCFEERLARKAELLEQQRKALGWLSPLGRLDRFSDQLEMYEKNLSRQAVAFFSGLCKAIEDYESRLGSTLPERWWNDHFRSIDMLAASLERSWDRKIGKHEQILESLDVRIEAADPHAPLSRGYSLVSLADDQFLRSVDDVVEGQNLTIQVKDGRIDVVTIGILPKTHIGDQPTEE